jgi:hypothetical protein
MAAPSVSFTTIPDSDIDADSPITVTLLTSIRNNLQHLREWLGDGYTAAKAHSHNGVDSAPLPGNAAGTLYAFLTLR